jgi:hypothetical protein
MAYFPFRQPSSKAERMRERQRAAVRERRERGRGLGLGFAWERGARGGSGRYIAYQDVFGPPL